MHFGKIQTIQTHARALEDHPLHSHTQFPRRASPRSTAGKDLRLPFNMLRLVLDELSDRLIAETQPLSESEKRNMVEFASEFQELCAKSVVALNFSKHDTKMARTNSDLVKDKELCPVTPREEHAATSSSESLPPLDTKKNKMSLDERWPANVESAEEEVHVVMATPAATEALIDEVNTEHLPNSDGEFSEVCSDMLIKLFQTLDIDGSGSLSADELRRGLIEAGLPIARLTKLLRLSDLNNSGEIELKEWIHAITKCNVSELAALVEPLSRRYTSGILFQDRTRRIRCALRPTGNIRIAIDSTLFCICCYLGIMSPFVVAWETDISDGVIVVFDFIDIIIMFIFSVELILNFFTGYFNLNDQLVLDPIRIAKHYLKTWFLLDFITTFPFSLIGLDRGEHVQSFKVLKFVKMFKIVKLMAPRQVDWADYSSTLESLSSSKFPQMIFKRSSLLIYLMVVCHWMACGMKLFNVKDTGFLSSYVSSHEDLGKEYLAALYWAMTTLTTVGYGDICPTSDGERIYTILAMVIGGGFYGYVVGSICSMVSNSDLNATAFYDRMELILAWTAHHRLPSVLKRRIRRHFKFYLAERAAITDAEVWRELTPEIQREVGEYILQLHVIKNPIFDGLKTGTVVRLQTILQKVSAPERRIIAEQGEAGTAMYILICGSVQIAVTDAHKEEILRKLGAAQSFGEEIVLSLAENYEYTAMTLEETTMEMMTEDDFLSLFTNMPHVIERMRQNAIELNPQWGQTP